MSIDARLSMTAISYVCVLSCLLIASVCAKDFNQTTIMLDGLKLEAKFSSGGRSGAARVECILTNTTSDPVEYDDTGPNLGFKFKLEDPSGNPIAKNDAWKKRYEVSDMSRHSATMISPNETLTLSLPLQEAFSAPARSGYRLKVEWDPGIDGKGNPLHTGRGLAVTLELKLDEDKISKDVSGPPNAKPNSSIFLVVIVVLIGSGIGLFGLLLKKRKQ